MTLSKRFRTDCERLAWLLDGELQGSGERRDRLEQMTGSGRDTDVGRKVGIRRRQMDGGD